MFIHPVWLTWFFTNSQSADLFFIMQAQPGSFLWIDQYVAVILVIDRDLPVEFYVVNQDGLFLPTDLFRYFAHRCELVSNISVRKLGIENCCAGRETIAVCGNNLAQDAVALAEHRVVIGIHFFEF